VTITALPTATVTAFDRNSLISDLAEATDPGSPPAILLVICLRPLGETVAGNGSEELLAELRRTFAELVGQAGSDYRTRGSELCAILHRPTDADGIVAAIEARLAIYAEPAIRATFGVVELPAEASDALSALVLADSRVTAAHGPVGFD
jgi:hypothetical protein